MQKLLMCIIMILSIPCASLAADYAGSATGAELDYSAGLTGNTQDQLDGKQSVTPTVNTLTVVDSGDGNPAAGTVTPASGTVIESVEVTCQDADGCTMTMSEATPPANKDIVYVWNLSANDLTFSTSAGVQLMVAERTVEQYEFVKFQYETGQWVEDGGNTESYSLIAHNHDSDYVASVGSVSSGAVTAADMASDLKTYWEANGRDDSDIALTLPPIGTDTLQISELGDALAFTSGGTYEVQVGDTITGATGGATATVRYIILSSGTWAGGDAAGTFILYSVSGTFEAENLDVGANSNVATIAGDSAAQTTPFQLNDRNFQGVNISTAELSGSGEFDFPALSEGWDFWILKEADQDVTLDPNGTEQWWFRRNWQEPFTQLGAGENITNTTAGKSSIFIQSTEDGVFVTGDKNWEAASTFSQWATTESFCVALSDEATALTTGTAKITRRMPYAFHVTDVRASVGTAPTGATIIVDINEGGSTLMTTNKLSIDASEKTSTTAATAAGLTDVTLADDAEMTYDIDQIGSGTAGAGLKVCLIGSQI